MTSDAAEGATVTLRAMRWWDIAAVLRLEELLFPDDAWSEATFWSELAERDTRYYLVAETADQQTVGYAGLCVYAHDQAFVQTIGVDAGRQRRGIGARLLDDLIAEAQRRGCTLLDLEVRADNAGAIALYEREGFRSIGVRRGYYQPSGADAAIMRKDLR
jgi:ribosomal-protein-alanine N-acetyltransferase